MTDLDLPILFIAGVILGLFIGWPIGWTKGWNKALEIISETGRDPATSQE